MISISEACLQLELTDNEQYDFRINNLTKTAIALIQAYEDIALSFNEAGYYVAFSGGKDSIVLADLFKKAQVKYTLNHNITGIDFPEVIYFMRNHYPKLKWHMYEKSMFKLIEEKGIPPTRLARYCCSYLKEGGGENCLVATGVRWAESTRRKNQRGLAEVQHYKVEKKLILLNDNDDNRREFETCQLKGKRILNPLIAWHDEDIWDYIKINNLPYPALYDRGYTRAGCIGCPLSCMQKRELEEFPKFKQAFIKAFDRMLVTRKNKNLETSWKNGEEVFNWWIG